MKITFYRLNNLKLKMSRKKKYLIALLLVLLIVYYGDILLMSLLQQTENPVDRRNVEARLQESLKVDRGTGCDIPKIDPFDKDIMRFSGSYPKIKCQGFDWVRCKLSECRVRKEILMQYNYVRCNYEDIIYVTNKQSKVVPSKVVEGDNPYILQESDHVEVTCWGYNKNAWFFSLFPTKWSGYVLGFRASVSRVTPKAGRESTPNVLILGFDSTSKNGFIRRMPKSYKTLKDDIGAVILNGYNILGDGTPAALFPMLTGKNELELPERRTYYSKEFLDDFPFIFFKLRDDGYRTAYFEDSPGTGTFQYRFNGFQKQPTDHYLSPFFQQTESNIPSSFFDPLQKYCVGDTPSYLVMMNATEQFLEMDGRKFIFTFIADICHNDFNLISTADEDLAAWLMRFKARGYLENTLFILMGDHGVRFGEVRDTLVGKLEERLPLMAIRLPERMKLNRPEGLRALERNADVLTTAYDIHVTLLDVLGLPDEMRLERARSLLQKIPANRSCSEAGIDSHWCSCLKWRDVSPSEPIYEKIGQALVNYINSLTETVRWKCHRRSLKSVDYVQRLSVNKQLLEFSESQDRDGYHPVFNSNTRSNREQYTVKITAYPNGAIYEASLRYFTGNERFEIDAESISRTNSYKHEIGCIRESHPHLAKYCYCKNL